MAQMNERDYDTREYDVRRNDRRSSSGSFKFNVAAPEFVPTLAQTLAPAPITGFFYPCFQSIDGTSGSWIYVADQEIAIPFVQSKPINEKMGSAQTPQQQQQAKEIVISDELKHKIIKQAEYMFSDMSMLANETLVKHVSKDPEGFVPINFVSTLKKLKSLNVNNLMVAQALRFSSKLVVSNDGKKVRRKHPFTEKEKEELQLRTVIAENLPDDHSHQKIEKMFNVVGSIKSIRICQPQEHNSSRSNKSDIVVSNKLHALVEYENPETAEKAAEKLNDEGNWRKGMRVRLMLKRSGNLQPKSVLKSRKSDFDACLDDDRPTHQASEDVSRLNTSDFVQSDENSAGSKKSWIRNRGKPKHRPQLQGARSLPTPSSHLFGSCPGQPMKGPRMPDGTRGFTMGRGKPIAIPVQSS
ncbi:hypothetical protein DH2020_044859 [Rehmannia glutinosa]|uniref:Uncharacterized protein n=1 Tax=Rehmannia glutinosa TaxID=99300 RepID=A0ABR0UHH4_REHGL